MTEVKLTKLSLASRLKKAATDLYEFLENPKSVSHPDAFLLATAHLIDVTSVELEAEITSLKRTLGGQTAKIAHQGDVIKRLETEIAGLKATLDKARNDKSPAVGMASGYGSH